MPAGQGKDQQRYAAAREELAHELALAAALDRSRTDLSPDAAATARMRARLFAAMAEMSEEAGPGAASDHDQDHADRADRADAGVDPAAATTVLPVVAAPAVTGVAEPAAAVTDASSTTAAPAEPVPPAEPGHTLDRGAASPASRVPRSRRNRHVLPRGYTDRPESATGSRRPGRPSGRKRVGIVAAAALFVMVALTGGGVLGSRNALPGDSLYGVKRAAESVGTALTFGEEARARRHLELASTRLAEIEQLASRHGTTVDPTIYENAIDEFDIAVSEGSRMLLGGENGPAVAGLGDLSTWAAQAQARWAAIRPSLPDPAVASADQSIALLERLLGRAEALQTRIDCQQVASGTDDLGPVPAVGACVPRTDQQATDGDARRSQSASAGSTTSQTNRSTDPDAATATPQSAQVGPDGGLLPGIEAPPNPLNPATSAEPGSTPTTAAPDAPGLLPPITLPPLLPGGKGITIGG